MDYRFLGQSGLQVSALSFGASRPRQVTENMAALEVAGRLDDGVLDRIEAILENEPEAERDWR